MAENSSSSEHLLWPAAVVEVPSDVLIQVMNVINRYAYIMDNGNVRLLTEVFTEDALIDTHPSGLHPGQPVSGIDKIIPYLGDHFKLSRVRRHVPTNFYVTEYSPDRVRVRCYLHCTNSMPTENSASVELTLAGEYDMLLIMNDTGYWRIRERITYLDRLNPE